MTEFLSNAVYFGVLISIFCFLMADYIRKKTKHPIFNPLLISIIATICFLILFNIPYTSYKNATSIISYLLTPAAVSLALPLYQKIYILKSNAKAIFAGIFCGVITSIITVLILSYTLNLSHTEYVSLLPKSITTSIGIGLSQELGGIVSITVPVIIVTGVFGSIFSDLVFRVFRISHPIAKGIALGCASHAIGTAKAFEYGEISGAMSSLSIAVSGFLTCIIAPFFSILL